MPQAQAGILPSKEPSLGVSHHPHKHSPCWEPINSAWDSAGHLNTPCLAAQTLPCCLHGRGPKHRLCPCPEALVGMGPALCPAQGLLPSCNSLHVRSCAQDLASSSRRTTPPPLSAPWANDAGMLLAHPVSPGSAGSWGAGSSVGGEMDALQEVGQTPSVSVEVLLVSARAACPAAPC